MKRPNGGIKRPSFEVSSKELRKPFLCFLLILGSMFLNAALAFLHARGMPVSSSTVIVVQALVTALSIPFFFTREGRFKAAAYFALAFIVLSTVVTNIVNPFVPKSIYDSLLIPAYIAVGMSAGLVRPKWMNYMLLVVLGVVLIEVLAPSAYVSLFRPAEYLSATREWIADQRANGSTEAGLYVGAFRNGGSLFSIADHRIGGPFLEPLSLGYFAFVMATYYAGIYHGSLINKFAGIFTCFGIALASDSRVPSGLILLSTFFLLPRLRLPVLVLWMTFPLMILTLYIFYVGQFSIFFGDTFTRVSVTFDELKTVNLGQMLLGMVPLKHMGDSGVLYMLRCVGLLGLPVAIWFYSGAFTYRRGANLSFFTMITVYLTLSLMFGGASLSIKTSSLLGYLVGLAGQLGMRGVPDRRRASPSDPDLLNNNREEPSNLYGRSRTATDRPSIVS